MTCYKELKSSDGKGKVKCGRGWERRVEEGALTNTEEF